MRRDSVAAVLVLSLVLAVATSPPASAQTQTLAQAGLPIIPLHHDHLFFTFDIDSCNPTQGYYITFQLNSDPTGTGCPETICIAPRLNCAGGGVARGRPGVASGTVITRLLPDGWTRYEYAIAVNGAFTQIWDVSRRAKVATGSTRINFRVIYEREQPFPKDRNYSVLGPIAHARDYPGVGIRNFFLAANAVGSGPSLLINGVTARWQLGNIFMQANNFATGDFQLTPR